MAREDKTEAPRRPRTWPRVLLALSLAMNLAVIGAILGAHVRDGRDARHFPPPDRLQARDSGFAPYLDALPRDVIDRAHKRSALGRLAEPEDIAHVVRFLCSADARHITGQTIVVDGGLSLE